MGWYSYNNWRPYVTAAERRRQAAKKIAKMQKAGREISPVEIASCKIAMTFWGDAWCKNLEAYSDYANRLPRGRTYVRNGSVIDLQIGAGHVRALVSGSAIYEVDIEIKPLVKKRWTDIKKRCAGRIDSLVELLRGSISKGVMEIVTHKGEGLFPSPSEISMRCSCPDWATMCKHVAATLYGVGARLDYKPEFLFVLRGVDPTEMVEAVVDQPPVAGKTRKGRVIETGELSSIFGVDMDMDEASSEDMSTPARPAKKSRHTPRTEKKSPFTTNKKTQAKSSAKKPAAGKAATRKIIGRKTTARKERTKRAPLKKAATQKHTSGEESSTMKPTEKKPGKL